MKDIELNDMEKKYNEFDMDITRRLTRLEAKVDLICQKIENMERKSSNLFVATVSAIVAGAVSYLSNLLLRKQT